MMPQRPLLLALVMLATAGAMPAGAHDGHHHAEDERSGIENAASLQVRVPDVEVVTAEGHKVRFYRNLVKGRVVVVSFIYTSCTAVCSPMTSNLRQVRRLLDPELAERVAFISISIDPSVDTPAVLRNYASQFGIDGGWTFVNADGANLAKLQRGFGASSARKEDHTPLAWIGNDVTGTWTRKLAVARPDVIADAIREIAQPGTR